MTPDENAARATEVYRRWRRTSLDVMGRSSWAGWTPEDTGFMVTLATIILLLILEPALWFRDWPPSIFGVLSSEWMALSLLAMPIHGWLLDRFLSAKTPAEGSLPGWLRVLRFIAACFPLFSFGLLPAWRILLERRPSWAFPTSRSCPPLALAKDFHRAGSPGRYLGVYTSGFFGVWMAIGFALPVLWALWLARTASLGAARTAVLITTCAVLHGVAFLGARFVLAPLRESPEGGARAAVPWLLLLPMPMPFVGTMLLVHLETAATGKDSLTWSAWARRGTASRLPLWFRIEESLQSHWRTMAWFRQWRRPRQIDRKIRDGELDRALLSFYRCKTALLLLEGSMIVAGLSSLSSLTPAIHGVLRFGWFFGLFLAGLGLAVLTVSAVARVLRISRLSSPLVMISARYLLLTQAAFLAGAQGGLLWMEGREGELGLLIGYAGALCGMLAWLFFLPSVPSGSGIKNGAFWSVLFLALALLGIPIGLNDRFGGWPGRLLEAAALLTPLWSLLLFRKFGHWLPRPFLWRNLSDSRLPKRVRTSLMFLKWTAMLPGGGLAIPAWIALREVLEREFRRRKTLPL